MARQVLLSFKLEGRASLNGLVVKNPPAKARDMSSTPSLGGSHIHRATKLMHRNS